MPNTQNAITYAEKRRDSLTREPELEDGNLLGIEMVL